MSDLLAITMGDPAGVGPEVIAKALAADGGLAARSLVIGDLRIMARAARLTGVPLAVARAASPAGAARDPGTISVLDLGNADPEAIPLGKLSPLAGRAAYEYVAAAVGLALAGEAAAVVTAPLNKEALNAAGYRFSGHTEILAALTGARDYAMMLVEGDLRVVHVSTHVPLRLVCDLVTRERVLAVIRLAHQAGRRLGLPRIRIGVAGVNPHAGEGGLFGEEETDRIKPAIEEARAEGIEVEGPLPPDTAFVKARAGIYDFAVAMYHDQGHIPVKMAGFRTDVAGGAVIAGVNVTLGLPIVRTSVDHGTAFDLAGQGRASGQSMLDALRLAVQLAGKAGG